MEGGNLSREWYQLKGLASELTQMVLIESQMALVLKTLKTASASSYKKVWCNHSNCECLRISKLIGSNQLWAHRYKNKKSCVGHYTK